MKIVLAASQTAADVLTPELTANGIGVSLLPWHAGARPEGLPGEEPDAVVVCALFVDLPRRKAEEELLEFPRSVVDLARTASVKRLIYLVPEIRGLRGDVALAFKSSVVMMKRSGCASILRAGYLMGVKGIWGGRGALGGVLVPGQGHGTVGPVRAEDVAVSIKAMLEDGEREEAAIRSFDKALPLGDYLSLVSGRSLKFHLPISLWNLRSQSGGWGLEASALAAYGKVVPSENHLEELTGRTPKPLAEAVPGKVPAWLADIAS